MRFSMVKVLQQILVLVLIGGLGIWFLPSRPLPLIRTKYDDSSNISSSSSVDVPKVTTKSKLLGEAMNAIWWLDLPAQIQNGEKKGTAELAVDEYFRSQFVEPPRQPQTRQRPSNNSIMRYVFKYHKMGYELINQIRGVIDPRTGKRRIVFPTGGSTKTKFFYPDQLPSPNDFKAVMVVRDIIEALLSNYMYHKSGHECWKGMNGGPFKLTSERLARKPKFRDWYKDFSYDLLAAAEPYAGTIINTSDTDKHSNNITFSFCHYLAAVPEYEGMRANIEYYFLRNPGGPQLVNNLAWMNRVQYFRERTLVVCYEDLASFLSGNVTTTLKAIDEIRMFFQLDKQDEEDKEQQHRPSSARKQKLEILATKNHEGHSTSHDPNIRDRLRKLVFDIDKEHYNGELFWLDSFWPCRQV